MVVVTAAVALRFEWVPEPDRHGPEQPRHLLVDGLHLVGADQADRDDRRPRLQGQPRGSGVTAMEEAVPGAGALGVDPEHAARAEHLGRGVERALTRAPAFAADGDLPDTAEEPRGLRIVEVLGLGHEGHAALDDQREEDRVEERTVVRGENRRTLTGDAIPPFHTDPVSGPQERRQRSLHHPIEHASSFPRSGEGYAGAASCRAPIDGTSGKSSRERIDRSERTLQVDEILADVGPGSAGTELESEPLEERGEPTTH